MGRTKKNADGQDAATSKPRHSLARRFFRGFRQLFLFAIFALLALAIYLNQVGLPMFVQKRLKQAVLAKGWQMDFTRVRLHSWRELVVESFHLRRTNYLDGPELFVTQAYCRFRPGALRRAHFNLDSLEVENGRLLLPVAVTNQPHRRVAFTEVRGHLNVKSDDQWELRNFQSHFLGANLHFMGVLTNASFVRDWKTPRPAGGKKAGFWPNVLKAIEPIRFQGTPQLMGHFYGDAADPEMMEANFRFAAPAATTPWGTATNVLMLARLLPPTRPGDIALLDLQVNGDDARTKWGASRRLRLHAQMEPSYPRLTSTNAALTIEVDGAETPWARAAAAQFKARLTSCPTNSNLLEADVTLRVQKAAGLDAQAATIDIGGHATVPPWKELRMAATNVAWPVRFAGVSLIATSSLTSVAYSNLAGDTLHSELKWQWPSFALKTRGLIAGGDIDLSAGGRADSRDIVFAAATTIDPHALDALLPAKTRRMFAKYSWEKPPRGQVSGQLRLPEWTKTGAEWQDDLAPTVALAGEFEVGAAAYRGVQFSSARSPFTFTNLVFALPHLKVTRPEGEVAAEYTADAANFHWRVNGQMDPRALLPLFQKPKPREMIGELEFTAAPWIDAEISGTYRDLERTSARGSVLASNFSFRGQPVGLAQTAVRYTNSVITLLEPKIQRPGEEASAPAILIDAGRAEVVISNAFGNLDPHAVARAIGRQAIRAIEAFSFAKPPTTRVSGIVDLKKKSYDDDLHFEVSGRQFRWKKFDFDELSGKIDWTGRTVLFSALNGSLHAGRATGEARFDFTPKKGANFSFRALAAEADLAQVAGGFAARSNKVEGLLSGEIIVSEASTDDLSSWQGYGHVTVRDGLLWDLPMFGLFSPVLNAFIPGMGNSRAREASATFTITNSVIHTRDLEVHATGTRMQFQGAIDLTGNVDARVEAELLRDIPAIGLILSKVLWPVTKLFEYQVTGTLNHPRAQPLYVLPKLFLQPLKTLRELIANEEPKGSAPR